MNAFHTFSFLALISLCTVFACTNTTTTEETAKEVKVEQVHGNWQVTEATRDGQATETLDGLFFRFSEAGQLSTNLLGSEVEVPFELITNKITQKSEPPLEYTVEEVNDQQLVLSTTLQGMKFKLTLGKGE